MDKRKLSKIERPVATKKVQEIANLVSGVKYIITVQRSVIEEEETLVMNFFRKQEDGGVEAEFRSFMQKDDYISQDLTSDKTKWKTGALDYLTGYRWTKTNIAVASLREKSLIMKFFKEYSEKGKRNEITRMIDCYQQEIKDRRLKQRRKKIIDEVEVAMKRFRKLPRDFAGFIEKDAFDSFNFIFYSRKKGAAYCSRCGKDFRLSAKGLLGDEKPKHNAEITCPCCKKPTACKSENMSRLSLYKLQWSVLLEKDGEDIHTRYFLSTKDMRGDYRKPKIETRERFRTIHTGSGVKDYAWSCFQGDNDMHWLPYKDKEYGWRPPSEWELPRSVFLYNKNLAKVAAGTWARYSAIDIFAKAAQESDRYFSKPWAIDWYLNTYRKQPCIEKIAKVGLFHLLNQIVGVYERGRAGTPIIHNENTITGILGISRNQYKVYREIPEAEYEDLCILRYAGEITRQEFDVLKKWQQGTWGNVYETLVDLKRYVKLEKLDRYLTKEKIRDPHDYSDYIGWLEEMKYDMRSEFNLYPKDFVKVHDRTANEVVKFRDKKTREAVRAFNKVLREMKKNSGEIDAMKLKIGGMFIRLPYKLEELKTEGEVLHHCVRTYIERVAQGKTMIFFIRKEDDPDRPFYTLEWKGRIIQCHGMRNCEPTPEVKAFITVFDEKMREQELKKAG